MVAVALVTALCLTVTPLSAETYRWKDKNGKVHYGATLPAEYADQPHDILNKAGLVIEHVEESRIPQEIVIEEEEIKTKEPLISDKQRQIQTDRLLVIQYRSEDEIQAALDLELAQLGYDKKLIRQSQDSASVTIREQIRLAADQQRAGQEVTPDQQKYIRQLHNRRVKGEEQLKAVATREQRIRERFQVKLERYQFLTSGKDAADDEQADQG